MCFRCFFPWIFLLVFAGLDEDEKKRAALEEKRSLEMTKLGAARNPPGFFSAGGALLG